MSHPFDHPDMGRNHGLDDRTAEEILRGRADAAGAEHQGLADALNAIRHSASAQPRPSEQLQSIFANGIAEDELAEAPSTAPTKRALPTVLARGGASLRGSVAKVAGLSLLMKLTLGGMAVAMAGVGGAGMAGVLPGQDRPEPEATEEADVGQEVADEAIEEGGVDGQEISERVREPRGDEPGGQAPPDSRSDVSDRADEADRPDGDPGDQADDPGERGLDEAEHRTGDTPAEERAPDTTADAREDADDRAERRSGEHRDQAPADGEPGDEQPGPISGSGAAEQSPDEPPTAPDQDTDGPGDRTRER